MPLNLDGPVCLLGRAERRWEYVVYTRLGCAYCRKQWGGSCCLGKKVSFSHAKRRFWFLKRLYFEAIDKGGD